MILPGIGGVFASIPGFHMQRYHYLGRSSPRVLLSLHHCDALLSETVLECIVLACQTVTSVADAHAFQCVGGHILSGICTAPIMCVGQTPPWPANNAD